MTDLLIVVILIVMKKNKVLPVILSRLGSSRLPAKSLLNIRPGVTVLENLVYQLEMIECMKKPLLATSDHKSDVILEKFSKHINLDCFRGSMDNVISRLYEASLSANADYVLRINSDSVIIDSELINRGINEADKSEYDYITNLNPRSYPYGISLQIINVKFLELCLSKNLSSAEKEHITPAIERLVDKDRVLNIESPIGIDYSKKRLVIDTLDDYINMYNLVSESDIGKKKCVWYKDQEILNYFK